MTERSEDRGTLGDAQRRLLVRAREFIRATENSGIDVATDALCYLNSWSQVPGYGQLSLLADGRASLGRFARILLKDIAAISRTSGFQVANDHDGPRDVDQIVVSWSKESDFQPDGAYHDRYFNTNSREGPKTLWFLIALDNYVPRQLDANIRVFARSPLVPKHDLSFLARSVVDAIRRANGRPRAMLHSLSSAAVFAREVAFAVASQLARGGIRSVVLPYEAQPWNHAVFLAAKAADERITTIGYLHSALPPLPTDLIRRRGAPDRLAVHGAGQRDILVTELEWPAQMIDVIPSLRYRVDDSSSLGGLIFLPYSFKETDVLIDALDSFLSDAPRGSLPPLEIRNHPVMSLSKRHLRLSADFNRALARHADRFAPAPSAAPLSVFIGATAAIVEALERGIDVIHLCSRPLFESHTEAIWPMVAVKRLGENAFRYRLRTPGAYINLGNEASMFERYFRHPMFLEGAEP